MCVLRIGFVQTSRRPPLLGYLCPLPFAHPSIARRSLRGSGLEPYTAVVPHYQKRDAKGDGLKN